MTIKMKPGAKTRAIDPAGKTVILDENCGPIDFLPETAAVSLVQRGAAEWTEDSAATKAAEIAGKESGVAPIGNGAAEDPRLKLSGKQLDEIAAVMGLDTSKLSTKAKKIAAIDKAQAALAPLPEGESAGGTPTDEEILEMASEYDVDPNAFDGNPVGLRAAVLGAKAAMEGK